IHSPFQLHSLVSCTILPYLFYSFSFLLPFSFFFSFFFFNDTATTEIYTLSLHDALPICNGSTVTGLLFDAMVDPTACAALLEERSEEHTSELQSLTNLVCRLLLEKKKKETIKRSMV